MFCNSLSDSGEEHHQEPGFKQRLRASQQEDSLHLTFHCVEESMTNPDQNNLCKVLAKSQKHTTWEGDCTTPQHKQRHTMTTTSMLPNSILLCSTFLVSCSRCNAGFLMLLGWNFSMLQYKMEKQNGNQTIPPKMPNSYMQPDSTRFIFRNFATSLHTLPVGGGTAGQGQSSTMTMPARRKLRTETPPQHVPERALSVRVPRRWVRFKGPPALVQSVAQRHASTGTLQVVCV